MTHRNRYHTHKALLEVERSTPASNLKSDNCSIKYLLEHGMSKSGSTVSFGMKHTATEKDPNNTKRSIPYGFYFIEIEMACVDANGKFDRQCKCPRKTEPIFPILVALKEERESTHVTRWLLETAKHLGISHFVRRNQSKYHFNGISF
jgi:hypothetical protein